MTIGGFLVDSADRAFVWCDAAVYSDGEETGTACKLVANALGPVAGTGCGLFGTILECGASLLTVQGIDGAMVRLPCALKGTKGTFGVAGFSRRFGRMVGAKFDAETKYQAQLCSIGTWPEIPISSFNAVDRWIDLIDPALEQMAVLQRHDSTWTGQILVVAELTRHGISTWKFPDFGARAKAMPPPIGSL